MKPVHNREVGYLHAEQEQPTGRRAHVKVDQLGDQARAASNLRLLLAEGASDDAIAAAWWSAVRLGCVLPRDLHQAGRAARSRETASRLAALPSYVPADHVVVRHFPQPPAPSLAQLFAVAELDRDRALRTLLRAVAAEDRRHIAEAAEIARILGAFDPEVPWSRVEDAEAMIKCAGELRAALRGDDLEGAASAWFRARAIWPVALSAEDAAAGRAAFRAWGHSMRRSSPDRGAV